MVGTLFITVNVKAEMAVIPVGEVMVNVIRQEPDAPVSGKIIAV
jgi:hypothetical protein